MQTCANPACGYQGEDWHFEAHHPDRKARPDYTVPLCIPCHRAETHRERTEAREARRLTGRLKSHRFELRITPQERVEWERAAKAEDRTLSEFIRRRVNASLTTSVERVTHAGFSGGMNFPVPVTPPEPVPISEWPERTEIDVSTQPTLVEKPSVPDRPGEGDGPETASAVAVQRQDPPEGFSTKAHEGAVPAPQAEAPSPCTNELFHVKGRFCTYCREVI